MEGESQSVGFERKVFLSVLWLVQWGRGRGNLRRTFFESNSPCKGHLTQKGAREQAFTHAGTLWGLGLRGMGSGVDIWKTGGIFQGGATSPLSLLPLCQVLTPPKTASSSSSPPVLLSPHLLESFYL